VDASTEVAAQSTGNVPSTTVAKTNSNVAPTSIAHAGITQQVEVQASAAPVQRNFGGSAATQDASTEVAAKSIRNVVATTAAGADSSFTRTSGAEAGITQPFAVQASAPPVQKNLGGSAATQAASTEVAAQSTRNVVATTAAGADSSFAGTSVAQAGITQPVPVQASAPPVQRNFGEPEAVMDASTEVAAQSTGNVPSTTVAKTNSNVAPTSIAHAGITQQVEVQASAAPAQRNFGGSAATQDASTEVAALSTPNVVATTAAETDSSFAQTSVAQADITQPVPVQASAAPVQRNFGGSAATQDASTEVTAKSIRNVVTTTAASTDSVVAQTNIAPPGVTLPVPVQASAAPVQRNFGEPAATQDASTEVAAKSTRSVSPTTAEPNSSFAQTSIGQPVAIQSSAAPVQLSFGELAATQDASTEGATQSAQNVPPTTAARADSVVAQTSIAQTGVGQQGAVQSSVAQLDTAPSQTSSSLPDAGIQEMKAPVAASVKSGNGVPSAASAAASDAAPNTTSDGMQDSRRNSVVNALTDAVQNTVAIDPSNLTPVPVLHAAANVSAREIVASGLNASSTAPASPAPATHDQSPMQATIGFPVAAPDQLVGLPWFGRSLGTNFAGVSGLTSAPAGKPEVSASSDSKDASTNQPGQKQHIQTASDGGSKSSSQDATPSNDQTQSVSNSQAQTAVPILTSFASHSASIAQTQNEATASPLPTAPTIAGATVHAATTPTHAAAAGTVIPQALPAINTAKLIQSMGQTEMRVGMRSTEFGNISINTSATRDLISAQISLDHGELAKVLAAHLPEMQSRMGGNQAMDVRINMNGSGAGQESGTSGSMSNNSSDQSRSGRQQAGYTAASQSGNGVPDQQLSSAVAAISTGYTRLDARLDIRV
jgi:hypothetical protein